MVDSRPQWLSNASTNSKESEMVLRDDKRFSTNRNRNGLVLQQLVYAVTAKNTKVEWTSQA